MQICQITFPWLLLQAFVLKHCLVFLLISIHGAQLTLGLYEGQAKVRVSLRPPSELYKVRPSCADAQEQRIQFREVSPGESTS
jgi:hypothetical protein